MTRPIELTSDEPEWQRNGLTFAVGYDGGEAFRRNEISILVEHHPTMEAHRIPVTEAFLRDHDSIQRMMDEQMDRWLRPWLYPDKPITWDFELFPTFERMRKRVRLAVNVRRHRWAERLDKAADAVRGSTRPGVDDW